MAELYSQKDYADLRAENERLIERVGIMTHSYAESEEQRKIWMSRAYHRDSIIAQLAESEEQLAQAKAEIDEMRKTWLAPTDDLPTNKEKNTGWCQCCGGVIELEEPIDNEPEIAVDGTSHDPADSVKPIFDFVEKKLQPYDPTDCGFGHFDTGNAMPRREKVTATMATEWAYAEDCQRQADKDKALADAVMKFFKFPIMLTHDGKTFTVYTESDLIEAAKE